MRSTAPRVSGHDPTRSHLRLAAALASAMAAGSLAAGCADLPVSMRDPDSAAPRSSAAPWRPPPRLATDRSLAASVRGASVAVDPDAVYGVADLIDFAHRANPDTRWPPRPGPLPTPSGCRDWPGPR